MPIGAIVPIFKAVSDDKVTDNGVVLNLGSVVGGLVVVVDMLLT